MLSSSLYCISIKNYIMVSGSKRKINCTSLHPPIICFELGFGSDIQKILAIFNIALFFSCASTTFLLLLTLLFETCNCVSLDLRETKRTSQQSNMMYTWIKMSVKLQSGLFFFSLCFVQFLLPSCLSIHPSISSHSRPVHVQTMRENIHTTKRSQERLNLSHLSITRLLSLSFPSKDICYSCTLS